MKNAILNKSLNFITRYKEYSKEEAMNLKYGLEGIYLTISKIIILFILSIILNMTLDFIILLLLFNFIRFFGFGAHAGKSGDCLLFSIICFIVIPFIFKNIVIPKFIILIIGICCIILLAIFAPADTKKRPFPKTKKKLFRKFMTVLIATIYLVISLIIKSKNLSMLFFTSIIIETVLVNPITYMILRQPYNNYKKVV